MNCLSSRSHWIRFVTLPLGLAFTLAVLTFERPKSADEPKLKSAPLVADRGSAPAPSTFTERLPAPLKNEKISVETPAIAEPLRILADGKRNIFTQEADVLSTFLQQDPLLLEKFALALTEVPTEKQIPARMEAITTFERVLTNESFSAAQKRRAEEGLTQVLQSSIGPTLPEAQKRILAAEKYDALTALIHFSPEVGLRELQRVEHEALRRILKPAAINALADLGQSLQVATGNVEAALAP